MQKIVTVIRPDVEPFYFTPVYFCMSSHNNEIKRAFLYTDENVKYTITQSGNQLSIHCDHPLFKKRFGGTSVTKTLQDFNNTSQKGMEDYDFFEKFKISLQEHYLTVGD